MAQPVRTTISFSAEATTVINACDPQNLSAFVSAAVEAYYVTEKQVLMAELNRCMTRAHELVPVLLPGQELILQKKKP